MTKETRLRAAIEEGVRHQDFTRLFIRELGWDYPTDRKEISLLEDGQQFIFHPIAEKHGVTIFNCECDQIPKRETRIKLETKLRKIKHLHLVIFTDLARENQLWQWQQDDPGHKRLRQLPFNTRQASIAQLVQTLRKIRFTLEDEGELDLLAVKYRIKDAFEREKVTKRFYDRFAKEHSDFVKFLSGIPDEQLQSWYASVMLNRLMFIYFIQKKGFLGDGDQDYLSTKFKKFAGKDFYRGFLCKLFFEGFAQRETERSEQANRLLGQVPYLNGGLFMQHEIEKLHGELIKIPNTAFEQLFEFFEGWNWHLDDRPEKDAEKNRKDEINPDVLGYIFEKYINRKQMGAYYTKEDITGYISQNTIIPFILSKAQEECPIAFKAEGGHVWELLRRNPERYIYEAVKRGVLIPVEADDPKVVELPLSELPRFVQEGMADPRQRMYNQAYNLGPAWDGDLNRALPTETWREYVDRRKRCLELHALLSSGQVSSVNDLITHNLNVRQFVTDVIESAWPDLLLAFWLAISEITVLDPTVGSGAFLFAALGVLEPLYSSCIDQMREFLRDAVSQDKPKTGHLATFAGVLASIDSHPNERYFIQKRIAVDNLYGVDIMEEACEICKLRLFLKLISQIDDVIQIEPLPDIDFNIRSGNTLVGFANEADVRKSFKGKLDFLNSFEAISEKARQVSHYFEIFHKRQVGDESLTGDYSKDKENLRNALRSLTEELDSRLADQYGVRQFSIDPINDWQRSHKPFHWWAEFYAIIKQGGFDAIIGNPPYLVHTPSKVGYEIKPTQFNTYSCKNLYAYVVERALGLLHKNSSLGVIVQLTVLSSERMLPLQDLLLFEGTFYAASFPRRPESIFDGVEMPVAILLSRPGTAGCLTTRVNRFYGEERETSLSSMSYLSHELRIQEHRIGKLGSKPALRSIVKLYEQRLQLESLVKKQSEHVLYYQEACRYWSKASKALPFFRRDGEKLAPPHGRTLSFSSVEASSFAMCLLNSSLFYLVYSSFSDCEHINDSLARAFPIPSEWFESDWVDLADQLSENLMANSNRKTIRTKDGHSIEYDELDASKSKHIIDQIDEILARHYRLGDEELDFIINYDIKYRFGRASQSNPLH